MPPSRATVFGSVAAAYAAHRPDYPDLAVDWAVAPITGDPEEPPPGPSRLLDLGAGTGKLSSALRTHGEVIAVEPDPAMLAQLRVLLPAMDARAGSAEAIPLPDAAVDAVLVGQAWHWFDQDRALPEVARVLRPGGVLAALWNRDDASVEWVAGLHRAADEGRSVPGVPNNGVPRVFAEHPAFGEAERASFANPVRTTVDGLLATIATHSWALVSDEAERAAAFSRIRDYLAGRPEAASGEFELPMFTEVARAVRR